jgi:hypothetical protein
MRARLVLLALGLIGTAALVWSYGGGSPSVREAACGIESPSSIEPASPPDVRPDDALLTDAREMAEQLDIPVAEAYRNLSLQSAVGVLDARLTENEAATFAGLFIEYEPIYRIVILGVTPSLDVGKHLPSALEPVPIVCRQVDFTLKDLRTAADQFYASSPSVPFDSGIDVETNRIHLTASSNEDSQALETAVEEGEFALPAEAFVVEVGPLSQPG